jgi:predicted PurR-regulated permease PerM
MDSHAPDFDREFPRTTLLDSVLRVGLIALLLYACSRVIAPLFETLIWSAILAVMLYPVHRRLRVRLGNRGSAVLIGIVGITVIIIPTMVVVTSAGSSVYSFVSGLQNHRLTVPPPPPRLASVPLVGWKLTEAWALVATNAPQAFARYGPMLKKPTAWLLSSARNMAVSELSFVLAFAIAAALVAYGRSAADVTQRILARCTGSDARGAQVATLTVGTIRGVALGVVGVAVIQSLLLGIGFFAIGLPVAGLLTLAAFFLCTVQVPAILLTVPIIAYVFATEPIRPAIIFLVWTVVAGLSDNILKPLVLGRGMDVPMPVILAGVIGGMIADGLLGLFVGPVLLATGYMLISEWARQNRADSGPWGTEDPEPDAMQRPPESRQQSPSPV